MHHLRAQRLPVESATPTNRPRGPRAETMRDPAGHDDVRTSVSPCAASAAPRSRSGAVLGRRVCGAFVGMLVMFSGAARADALGPDDWPLATRDGSATRYSELAQITPGNVRNL